MNDIKYYKWYIYKGQVKVFHLYFSEDIKLNVLEKDNTMITKENNSTLFREKMLKKLSKDKYSMCKKMDKITRQMEALKW